MLNRKKLLKLKNFFYLIAMLVPLFALISCAKDYSVYAKISLHTTGEKNSFIFTVSEEFLDKNSKSLKNEVKDQKVKISKVEFNLLKKLLKEKKFCLNKNNDLAFEINSRQEKIYDMTFSHLIATSYRAKPLTPRSYFGNCL